MSFYGGDYIDYCEYCDDRYSGIFVVTQTNYDSLKIGDEVIL